MKKYRTSIFGGVPRSPRSRGKSDDSRVSGRRSQKSRKAAPRKKRGLASFLSLVMILVGVGILGYSAYNAAPAFPGMVRAMLGTAEAPDTTDMTLTVPDMARVDESPVYTAPASDTPALDAGAVHVEGTGFPWEDGSNVYIAGHRIGYPGTGSFRQFYDLHKLENGDEIILSDANGTTYTYTVFEEITVAPTEYQVTAPVPGKSVVSLQTCTLPYYTERLIVRGELTSVA